MTETSTALSADLFTLSKKTSVGRLGELQAAAGAFGAAELDFFSECGAVCRLTAAAEAGIYGSLSIGMALEDFRRLYAHDQAGLAMRLGEIFLDEVAARARRAKPKRAKR